ncbi:MAG: glycosyltransferase family 4 protein [bacterium]
MKLAHLTTSDISLELLLGHQLRAFQAAGFDVTAISGDGPWIEALQAAGIRHLTVPTLRRSWAPLADVRACTVLTGILRRERFDIVHTHNPKTGVFGRIAARLVGTPVVVNTVHGLYGTDGGAVRRAMYLGLERLASACSDFEFCQSREDLQMLRRLGIARPDRSAFIGNGVNLTVFDPDAVDRSVARAALGIDAATTVVGTIGRLVWEKGYREFFAMAERVRARRPGVCFIAVGPRDDGKADAVPQRVTADLERRGIVRFMGLRTDLPALYRAMDIFVLPSYREGFPRSAVEAAAMGLPLVLTDVRGCREVVTGGRNGLLVQARDADALEEAVLSLLDAPDLRRKFGEANRQKALAEFDERRIIDQILGVYRTLLVEKSGRAVDGIGQEGISGR